MTKTTIVAGVLVVFLAVIIYARQTVYPTGTTIYKPDKCWNGFTVFSAKVTESPLLLT